MLDRFEPEDGFSSPFILTFFAIAVISLVSLVVWGLVHDQPVMNLRLFKIRAFAISNVVMFLFGFIIISTTQLVPQLAQELLHYDATTARLMLAPQVLRVALPGLGNVWQMVVKESVLVSVTGLVELMRQVSIAAGSTRKPFEFYAIGAVVYLVLTTVSGALFAWAERRSGRAGAGA